ncbi:hypothetical protein D3C80_1958180 [compost metagenome]
MHFTIGRDLGEHPRQFFMQAFVNGIHRLGAVQAQGQHATVEVEFDELVVCRIHGVFLCNG